MSNRRVHNPLVRLHPERSLEAFAAGDRNEIYELLREDAGYAEVQSIFDDQRYRVPAVALVVVAQAHDADRAAAHYRALLVTSVKWPPAAAAGSGGHP